MTADHKPLNLELMRRAKIAEETYEAERRGSLSTYVYGRYRRAIRSAWTALYGGVIAAGMIWNYQFWDWRVIFSAALPALCFALRAWELSRELRAIEYREQVFFERKNNPAPVQKM